LSIATTLPEKLVAFKSGRKAEAGVLVANTVGSNVFLLTLVLGIVWVAKGVTEGDPYAAKWLWVDLTVVLGSSVLLWGIIWANMLRRSVGASMLVVYVIYIVHVVLRG
jgi:Ca2+/Na+ antiporter